MQDQQLVATLLLPEPPPQPAGAEPSRPVIKLFARGGELHLSRIQLFRDVYYLTVEQAMGYPMPGTANPVSLAADEYFVLGDNSRMSQDARFFGPIRTDAVKGLVCCTYWPPSRIRSFATRLVRTEQ